MVSLFVLYLWKTDITFASRRRPGGILRKVRLGGDTKNTIDRSLLCGTSSCTRAGIALSRPVCSSL